MGPCRPQNWELCAQEKYAKKAVPEGTDTVCWERKGFFNVGAQPLLPYQNMKHWVTVIMI
jgi:hypothetical protein